MDRMESSGRSIVGWLPHPLRRIAAIGAHPADDEVTAALKELFATAHVLVALPLSIPFVVLLRAVDERAGALAVVWFMAMMGLAVEALRRWPERFGLAASISSFALLALALARPLAVGAYPNYATGTLWGVLAVVTIITIVPRWAVAWFAAFLGVVGFVVVFVPSINPDTQLPLAAQQAFAVIDISAAAAISLSVIALALRERRLQQQRADALLHAILPREVARRLRGGPRVIADRFESVSVLFADAVGFTPLSASMAPEDLVGMLDEVFSDFDAVVERAGLEKIKTVGDTYMVAAGVPAPRADHAPALVDVALELRAIVDARTYRGHRLAFRFGVNSGPAVAGVIGRRKFSYDLWGDTVNVASRMESHGAAGEIQITAATRELLDDRYQVAPLGTIEVKGRGAMPTWRVMGRRP